MEFQFLSSGDSVQRCSDAPNVFIIHRPTFRADRGLVAALSELVAPSYEDPTALLARELEHCNSLYFGTDAEGRLTCFFLVAWESLQIEGLARPSVYLGLSAVRDDLKGSEQAKLAYACGLKELAARERVSQTSFVLWGTTATPLVYLNAYSTLADTNPLPDGRYSDDAARVARAIRLRLGAPDEGGHPFVLKRIAHGTRYSDAEAYRIASISRRRQFTLFDRLGLVEPRGDRLLFIARSPWSSNSSTPEDWTATSRPPVEIQL